MFKKLRLYPSDIFSNDFQGQELRYTVVKGSMALVLSQGISFGLSMVNAMVLARLLTPSDYGLVGMVTVFINFLVMIKDAGLSTATIQNNKITNGQISTLFWINSSISLVLGIIVLFSAPLVAVFYKKPELTTVTAVLSISFILQGLSIQHYALLQRHLKYTVLAINEILAQLINLTTAIIMALNGFGYWALVGGTMARTITLLLLTYFSCPWLPGKMQKGTGVRSMVMFGGRLTFSYLIGYLSRNLDNLLIGRFVGAEPLGLYSRAYSLLMQPLSQVTGPLSSISLPVLSALKNDQIRYNSYYRKLLDISISLALPISVYCFLESEFLVRVLLGEKWMDAEPVFKIMSIAGVFVATSGAPGLVMISHGFSKRYLHLSLMAAVIVSVSFIIGIPFGITGVAVAFTIASFIKMIPYTYFGIKGSHVKIHLILRSVIGPVFSASVAGLLAYFFIISFTKETILKHILIGLIFFILYTFLTLLRPKTRDTLRSIKESVFSKSK